jgi:hypothetical protein
MPRRDGRTAAHVLALSSLLVAACVGSASPNATPEPPASSSVVADRDHWLIVGRSGETGLRVIVDRTLETVVELPIGIPDASWGHVLTATPGSTTTHLEDVAVLTGDDGDGRDLDGRWRLPTVGLDPIPVGRSADGSTIVLDEVTDDAAGTATTATTSRFLVLDGLSDETPRVIELDGAFDFDTLSPDGSILYVTQQLPGPPAARYQVRAVDTSTGVMRDGIIVDKRNVDERMAGYPLDQDRRPDGLVLTLYRGLEHPFIHALASREAWAVCIDLPARAAEDEVDADWGVVSLPAGRGDVAVNATLGLAIDIDPAGLTIRRTVDFEPNAIAGARLAKFGHGDVGPAGRRVVVAPDGRSLFAAGAGGVVRLAADDLSVMERALEGTAIDGLAVSTEGLTLFALTRSGGRIAEVDVATGQLVGWLGDGGYDRLLGAVPG